MESRVCSPECSIDLQDGPRQNFDGADTSPGHARRNQEPSDLAGQRQKRAQYISGVALRDGSTRDRADQVTSELACIGRGADAWQQTERHQGEGPPQKWSEHLNCGKNLGRVRKDKPDLHKANRELDASARHRSVGGGTQENNLAAKAKTSGATHKRRTRSPPKGVQTAAPPALLPLCRTPLSCQCNAAFRHAFLPDYFSERLLCFDHERQ